MREIRTLRAMWRVLETEPRQFLTGHEEGNLGYMPRRSLRVTAPVPDPTSLSHLTPTSLVESDFDMQQGPFAPQALPRFFATTGLAAAVSPFIAFPLLTVIRSTLLHRFLDGTRTVSPVAWHVLVTVLPLPPRRSVRSHRSVAI